MTDPSSFIITHPIAHSFPVAAPPAQPSPLPNGTLSDTNVPEEEEYTIKCICGYADDDGNTVYCPKCDTWQHIECYYPSRNVPEDHFCADCLPRELDARRAAERQRRHREAVDSGDRKKRLTSKNHRKKHKDSISIYRTDKRLSTRKTRTTTERPRSASASEEAENQSSHIGIHYLFEWRNSEKSILEPTVVSESFQVAARPPSISSSLDLHLRLSRALRPR